jgi:hypothetical protein
MMAATALLESVAAPAPRETDRVEDDDYEVVNCQRVEAAPMSAYADCNGCTTHVTRADIQLHAPI